MTDKTGLLDERHPPRRFRVEVVRDERTGDWVATCPFCGEEQRAALFIRVESMVFAHLNARHDRRGH